MAEQENKECLLLNESCGCKKNSNAYPKEVKIEKEEFFFSFYNFMSEDLISAHDIKECIWKIDWYTENIENYNGKNLMNEEVV